MNPENKNEKNKDMPTLPANPVLPTKLYITEGRVSSEKSEQERHTPDPTEETFAKLVEDAKNELPA